MSTHPSSTHPSSTRLGTGSNLEADAPAGADPGVVIDLDEVATVLVGMGIAAEVAQTGGGCATIYAGPTRPHPFEAEALAFAALAGPGRYGWGRQPSVAALDEIVIGPDDCGETTPTEAALVGARHAAAVARLIAEQVNHPERAATDTELAAAGFDPAPARAARERSATLAAGWCPPIPARGSGDVDTSPGVVVAEQLVTVAAADGALRVGIHVGPGGSVLPGECIPIVVEVEGESAFSLDEHGRAVLHGQAPAHQHVDQHHPNDGIRDEFIADHIPKNNRSASSG